MSQQIFWHQYPLTAHSWEEPLFISKGQALVPSLIKTRFLLDPIHV